MSDIFSIAEEAWKYLVSHGGLEVNGRDADLVEAITKRLTSEPVVPDYEDIHKVDAPPEFGTDTKAM